MSIKLQKILRFIPFVNFIIVWFGWYLTARKCNTNTRKHSFVLGVKSIAILLVLELPLAFIADELPSSAIKSLIVGFVTYCALVVIATLCIRDQEQMLKEHEINKW